MFRTIGAVVTLVVLLATLWAGFKWGSRDLAATRAELEQIRKANDILAKSNADFGAQLDKRLAEQATAHDARMADLKQHSDADMAQLKAGLDSSDARAAGFRAQAQAAEAKAAALRRTLQTAPAAQQAALKDDIANASASATSASTLAAAEDCLKLPVPTLLVRDMNRVSVR